MELPNSYTLKPNAIPDYFDALLNAQAPQRFSQKFLENLEFKSTNDRLFIGILRDLGFIDGDGVPTERYYRYLDRSQSQKVLAEGIREAFSGLFAVHTRAHELSADDVYNKLRTLYAGQKSDETIRRIASTFTALCAIADFAHAMEAAPDASASQPAEEKPAQQQNPASDGGGSLPRVTRPLSLESLQYHINIVLPETRDQAVFDAIFKSMADHLRR